MHKGKIGLIAAAACLAATLAVGLSAYAPATLTPQEMSRALATLHVRLADGHSDACKANFDQCMKGCSGATSCSNQCQTNYNGCMGNGG